MKKYLEAYKELYTSVYDGPKKYKETNLADFIAMKGKRYSEENKKVRFMLVGRATNGWGELNKKSIDSYVQDVYKTFTQEDRFHTEWNMKDIDNNPYSEYVDSKDGKTKKYYLSKSPFWSSSKEVWCKINHIDNKPDWFDDIVWSNIYKVAPMESGNPSTSLIYAQAPACVKILKEEINTLKPTHILLVIDESWISWTYRKKVMFDFMEAFDNIKDFTRVIPENQQIVHKAFISNGIKVIVTCRPEQVSREEYADVVFETFCNMNK